MCKGKEVCPLWTDPATGNRIAATGCSWDQLLPTSFEAAHEKRLTCECSGAKGDRCVLYAAAALESTTNYFTKNQELWLLDSSRCSMCETIKCVMLATPVCCCNDISCLMEQAQAQLRCSNPHHNCLPSSC